jgi:hypothetical protein
MNLFIDIATLMVRAVTTTVGRIGQRVRLDFESCHYAYAMQARGSAYARTRGLLDQGQWQLAGGQGVQCAVLYKLIIRPAMSPEMQKNR